MRFALGDPASIDLYTEEEYNRFGWARVNNVISPYTNREFQRHPGIAAYRKGRTADGFLIVDAGREFGIGNTIIITDGRKNAPSIERVYQISRDNYDDAERVRRDLYAAEKKYGGAALYLIGDDYGLVSAFERSAFSTFEELSSQSERGGVRGLRSEAGESNPELSDRSSSRGDTPRYALGGVSLPSPDVLRPPLAAIRKATQQEAIALRQAEAAADGRARGDEVCAGNLRPHCS